MLSTHQMEAVNSQNNALTGWTKCSSLFRDQLRHRPTAHKTQFYQIKNRPCTTPDDLENQATRNNTLLHTLGRGRPRAPRSCSVWVMSNFWNLLLIWSIYPFTRILFSKFVDLQDLIFLITFSHISKWLHFLCFFVHYDQYIHLNEYFFQHVWICKIWSFW